MLKLSRVTTGLLAAILAASVLFLPSNPVCAAGNSPGSPASGRDVNDMKNIDYKPFVAHLRENGKPPIDYVTLKFKDHDVVILGEMHEIKEYCQLIADLVEPLYHKAGVRVLAMEIPKSKNNDMLHKVVTGEEYNREMALDVFRDAPQPIWGFKEYVDILKAVWEVNRKLPEPAEKFRVVGLSSDWDALRMDSYDYAGHEKHMADVLAQEALEKGQKALVQIGYAHSFLRYRQPKVENGKFAGEFPPRFGYILYEKYGDRVFQVCLHHPHIAAPPSSKGQLEFRPVLGGLIEKSAKSAGGKPAAFDVENSPFANLRDRKSYFFAYQKDVVFSDVAQGYIILKPFDQLRRKMTWIDGFITERNFKRAGAFALARGWIKPNDSKTPQELDRFFKAVFEN